LQETEAARDFHRLAETLGVEAPDWRGDADNGGIAADLLRNADLQAAVFDAYRKDFVQFGFARSAPE
jgi:hypothetical protein